MDLGKGGGASSLSLPALEDEADPFLMIFSNISGGGHFLTKSIFTKLPCFASHSKY